MRHAEDTNNEAQDNSNHSEGGGGGSVALSRSSRSDKDPRHVSRETLDERSMSRFEKEAKEEQALVEARAAASRNNGSFLHSKYGSADNTSGTHDAASTFSGNTGNTTKDTTFNPLDVGGDIPTVD
jgi:hypothetical protein